MFPPLDINRARRSEEIRVLHEEAAEVGASDKTYRYGYPYTHHTIYIYTVCCRWICIYIHIIYIYTHIYIFEGSLNSKLPTIWRVEKQMKSR